MMQFLPEQQIVIASLVDLEHCGFDYGTFESELFLSGIDEKAARFPVMLTVNFTGGAVITPDTKQSTTDLMLQKTNKFQEYLARILTPSPFTIKYTDPVLLEKLADIEHQQWIHWSRGIAYGNEKITQERLDRWNQLWKIPYSALPEDLKQHDRVWARKMLEVLRTHVSK